MTIEGLIQLYPKISIIVISGLVSLFISFVNHFVLDKEKVKASKDKQKRLKEELKLHKGNQQKMMELNKAMMEDAMQNMSHSFKPMLITIIPMFIVLAWIRNSFNGVLDHWIWWYIVSALIFSMIFRKMFKLP
mgnify:CR=1 FL=1